MANLRGTPPRLRGSLGPLYSLQDSNGCHLGGGIQFHDDQQQSVITGKDMSMSLLFLCIWLLFAGLAILAISTLQGATIRAVAEIYRGKRPSWLACLEVGWKNMFKITCLGFLVVLACCTAFLPFVVGVLAAIYSNTSSSSPDY